MSKVFVISDTWFNRIVSDDQDNIIDNNENIILSWNNVVSKDDIVYVLGGFGISDLYHIVIRLNGEIHFLNNYLNDDEKSYIDNMREEINKSFDNTLSNRIIFEDKQIMSLKELDTIISYFPLIDWCGKETGTYCFHGLNDYIDIDKHNITCVSNIPVDIAKFKENIETFKERM